MNQVLALDDAEALRAALDDLQRGVEAGAVVALALVVANRAGGLEPSWGARAAAGPHAGSVLRGAVAYLAAMMDAAALAPAHEEPIVFGSGETWTP